MEIDQSLSYEVQDSYYHFCNNYPNKHLNVRFYYMTDKNGDFIQQLAPRLPDGRVNPQYQDFLSEPYINFEDNLTNHGQHFTSFPLASLDENTLMTLINGEFDRMLNINNTLNGGKGVGAMGSADEMLTQFHQLTTALAQGAHKPSLQMMQQLLQLSVRRQDFMEHKSNDAETKFIDECYVDNLFSDVNKLIQASDEYQAIYDLTRTQLWPQPVNAKSLFSTVNREIQQRERENQVAAQLTAGMQQRITNDDLTVDQGREM